MAKILFDDKVKLRDSELDEINKLTDANVNEIKGVVNGMDDRVFALENGSANIIDVSAIWISGLSFDVTANSFPILDTYKSATSAIVTLNTSDITYGRFDFIVAHAPVLPNTIGTVGKLTGTPSENPADPDDFDPSTMYLIKRVLVPALATEPQTETGGSLVNENVYIDGTGEPNEWTFSSNNASIVNVGGLINATNPLSGHKATLTNNSNVVGLDSDKNFSLSFDITLKANLGNSYIFIKLFNDLGQQVNTSLLFNDGDYGLNKNLLTTQNIVIDGSKFSFIQLGSFRGIQIYPFKSFAGYTLDNIKFHVGSAVIPVPSTHVHSNFTLLESITQTLVNNWNVAYAWVLANGANVLNHLTRTDNPHSVTKAQVGLGNADNTSDANKPVSTAQQTALDLKLDDTDALTAVSPTNKLITEADVVGGGTGDMLAATYDPTAKNTDAFDMANMVESATKKILTDIERTAIATNSAKVTNATHTGEVTGSGALTIESGVVDRDNLHVSLKTRITNATVTGTYTLNHALGNDWKLTLTGITTFNESNLPTGTDTLEFTMKVTGDFGLTVPAYWTVIGDTYNGTIWNFFTVQIHKGDATQEATCFISNF